MLRLDTRFPRILGDLCHFATWPFPMLEERVKLAEPHRVIAGRCEGLLDDFMNAGLRLRSAGAMGLTSSCGFMSLHSEALREACGIPTLLGALEYLPDLHVRYGEGNVGVLTISASALTAEHFLASGVFCTPPICGVAEDSHFAGAILGNEKHLDFHQALRDNVSAACRLCDEYPHVKAILLECTNMPPYAEAIREAVGRPTYSLYDGVLALYASL